jgi:hypothetical protein
MTDKREKTPALATKSHDDSVASPPPTFDGDLTDLGTLKRLLARHGVSLNKGLGQHLLTAARRSMRSWARLTSRQKIACWRWAPALAC